MKKSLLILPIFTAFTLNASNIGSRIHECAGSGVKMTFSESSFIGQPIISMELPGKISWHMMGPDIQMRENENGLGIFVEAFDQEAKIAIDFYAHIPANPNQPTHVYETSVKASDSDPEHEVAFFDLTCQSRKVQF